MEKSLHRARWAVVGAVAAVVAGIGGLQAAQAALVSGERAVYVAITPCRLANTRPAPANVGPRTSPLGANDTYTLPVIGSNGNCAISSNATALVLTLTAVDQTQSTFLTVWPTGQPVPTAASLTVSAAGATSTAATVDVGTGDQISIFNKNGSVNVVVDIVGFYADHNHDDRYYTEAEVDQKLVTAADDYWGSITASGTVYLGSNNFTIGHPDVGRYCIVVPTSTAAVYAAVVTVNNVDSQSVISTGSLNGSLCNPLATGGNGVVPVYVRSSTGVLIDANFNFYIPRR